MTGMALTLAEANRAIDAALAKARELEIEISVTVCDARGRLVAHQRMDRVFDEAPLVSIGKAIGAASVWQPDESSLSPPPARQFRTDTVIGESAPCIGGPGGLPIIRSGDIEGAIGVSGALDDEQNDDEQNEECARAGVEVLEMEALSTSR
jgi:glc operon protein GlcG